ncbi:hypothetical protein F5B20DRAFT_250264 [Whalleya microplaca]|nr:hypothetical protein F5B20DRAFT_250264 [Whalleya microplaca]
MPLQIPHPSAPLHLYRHLLREASYLPPLCQPYITERIRDRFRDCSEPHRDTKVYIKEAHHSLRYLRSATAGHVERLLHLCYMATGRVGKRRRQLASALLAPSPSMNSSELDQSIRLKIAHSHREPDWLDNWSTGKIKAIAASQVQQQSNAWPQQMRRMFDPIRAIPNENSFGRPLTNRLSRNKLKSHWASVLHQLLPPLPRGEWDQLGALVHGQAEPMHYQMPKRRPVAQSASVTTEDAEQWDWTKYVTAPVRSIERGSSRRMKSLTGQQDEDPRGQGRPIGVRVLGPRRFRRALYGRVWETSPVVQQKPQTGKWGITWGKSDPKVSNPARKDFMFFQGIDQNGKLKRPTRSTTPRGSPE